MSDKLSKELADELYRAGGRQKKLTQSENEEKQSDELKRLEGLQSTYQENINKTKQTLLGLLMSDFGNDSMVKFYIDDLEEFFEGYEETLQAIEDVKH